MELSTVRRGPRVIVHLTGELDHHSASRVRGSLDLILKDVTVREMQLDLSQVTFMDSAGLGVVLGRYKTISARGGRMIVSGVRPPVDRIFRMSGIYALVERM